jgi:hypothetical protein
VLVSGDQASPRAHALKASELGGGNAKSSAVLATRKTICRYFEAGIYVLSFLNE